MKVKLLVVLSLLPSLVFAVPQKIISLAPHTTELAYDLGVGQKLVAVSDFSDYPAEASNLSRVASHNGLNFEKIVQLQPDLILAWKGGNKPQDLARLSSLGFTLFYSNPATPDDIANEILALGQLVHQEALAKTLSSKMQLSLEKLRRQYKATKNKQVFYYMWPKPMMSIGKGAWANKLLSICGATNVFADVIVPYPEVTMEEVLKRQPDIIIAAFSSTSDQVSTTWKPWRSILDVPVISVNPDKLHRFTPRLIEGITELCERLN